LRAYRTIATWRCSLRDLAATDYGTWALNVALKQIKKRYSATSMMELTVWRGSAVQPFAGWKTRLPHDDESRVVNDYRERYEGMVSIIASQMAGRPISKEPHLAFLGTTSLYTDHSSQYNRVKLPPGLSQANRRVLNIPNLDEPKALAPQIYRLKPNSA
jgi:hypothetical protein